MPRFLIKPYTDLTMDSEERIRKQKELIEEVGRHFDKEGFQPIAGRILGLLMIMDKEQYTFDEITEELQISKSSASNALRNLEIRGNIEYVTHPGDRKRYFQLKQQNAFAVIEDIERKMKDSKRLFINAVALKADKNSRNAIFLKDLTEMIDQLLENIGNLKSSYKK